MGLIEFIFGKKPDLIFTKDGRVKHDHDPKKWQAWRDRFEKNPNYDWRKHAGTKKK